MVFEVNMKLFILIIAALFSTTVFSDELAEKMSCDSVLSLKSASSVDKCLPWLKFANAGVDAEKKAVANMDYAQALQYADKSSEAEYFLLQATKEAVATKNTLIVGVASEVLARYYYGRKEYVKAHEPLQKAIDSYASKLGLTDASTINSTALLADINRLEGNYRGAIEIADKALLSIPEGSRNKLAVSSNLYNIRALSNEKIGNAKIALPDYILAAQIMEKFDHSSAINMWKNVRSFLLDFDLTKDVSAVDQRISVLTEMTMVQRGKRQVQLSPRVSLEIGHSSIKE